MLQPGEQVTQIVLRDADDPGRGTSLAALRDRFGGERIELPLPWDGGHIALSTADWADDPEQTFVVITHHRRPTAEEAAAEQERRGGASPFPPDAEAARQEWLATGAPEREERFHELLRAHGWTRPVAGPTDGVEVEPGVYLLDARTRS